MKCPYCSTENRDDSQTCHHCGKDISMLRLIVGKARHHYNVALEHAERQRYAEALNELEHALELDRSFVPAHVVMGTVYARMEKFEDAERCWKAALALDPHILKAHEYLGKSGAAVMASPVRRQFRRAIALALATAAVFLIATLWQLRPTPDRKDTDRVVGAIEQGDYATALDGARHLAQTARHRAVRRAAEMLKSAIGQKYESAGLTMLKLLLEDKPIEARRLYLSLSEKGTLPDPYKQQLAQLDRNAAEQAGALVDAWGRMFQAGNLTYAELQEKIEPLRKIFDEPNLLARIDSLLASARRTMVAETLELVPAATQSTSETLTWLARLETLASQVPESRDEIASATERLIAATLDQLGQRVDTALGAEDVDAVQSVLDDLAHLSPHAPAEIAGRLVDKARKGLRRLETERLRVRLTDSTTADIPKVDEWIASFERRTSSTVENDEELAELARRTRRRLAAEMLRWCTVRDARFEQRRITPEEARWTVERADFTIRHVVGKDWRYVRDNMTFYAGIAWLELDDAQEASRWFDRLATDYPDSPYVPLMRRYRQAIEDQPTSTPPPGN